MPFLIWHYTKGINYYQNKFKHSLGWINHQFSPTLLLKTLFAPWKRMTDTTPVVGINLNRIFDKIMDQLISRGVGAVVRVSLFLASLLLLAVAFVLGLIGGTIWLLFPPVSLLIHNKEQTREKAVNLPKEIADRIRLNPSSAIKIILESVAGKFVLDKTGLKINDFQEAGFTPEINSLEDNNFEQIINWTIKNSPNLSSKAREKGVILEDISTSARWWDRKNKIVDSSSYYSKPGIGVELLFGYTPNLDKYITDLGAPASFTHHLVGREAIVNRIERNLEDGRGVILIGDPGVGKRTVVLEFAHRARTGKLGKDMSYKRVLEFDYNSFFSGITDINQKKNTLSQILMEATNAGNVILVLKDIHRITDATVEGYDFTDVIENCLSGKRLQMIAISDGAEYERFINRNQRLRKYFETVEVTAPTKEEALEILMLTSEASVPVLRKIIDVSDKYISETPFPEKAMELYDAVLAFKKQTGGGDLTTEDVEKVITEKTGISIAYLNEDSKKELMNLEDKIKEKLVGQDNAVSLIAKSLRSRVIGVKDENKPIGSFLFLGPTGVGKTQTAKVLAEVYYGSAKNIIRFDLAEYAGREGLERLIGSISRNQPGLLTTEIKNHPSSLLLLDEIEKAPKEIYNLLLALLDEGVITDAFGKKINCKHLFVIVTTNAGAEKIRQKVTSGVTGEGLQKDIIDYVQKENIFSPELLNRFDGLVVYSPLSQKNLVKVAEIQLKELSENIKQKNLTLSFTQAVAEKVAMDGYDPAYGARPMKRIIDLEIGDLLSQKMIRDEIGPGDRVTLDVSEEEKYVAYLN